MHERKKMLNPLEYNYHHAMLVDIPRKKLFHLTWVQEKTPCNKQPLEQANPTSGLENPDS